MHTFKDKKDRDWTLCATVASIRRVRADTGVNLFDLNVDNLNARLVSDLFLVFDLLWAFCKPDAEKQGVTVEEFEAGFDATTAGVARAKLYEELVDFFQRVGRTDLAEAIRKSQTMADLGTAESTKRIKAMNPEAVLQEALKAASSSLPGSSESTPPPAPSEN